MMYGRSSGKIAAILDRALAAVVPYQLWNPENFLHDTKSHPSIPSRAEESCVGMFERICGERVKMGW